MPQSVSTIPAFAEDAPPPRSPGQDHELDQMLLGAVEQALGVNAGPRKGGLPRWRLQRVTRHIEDNISHRLTIYELAGIAQMSPSHFSRTFRATVGVSPHGYVTRRRVAAAQALIARSDVPLAEVAVMCGTVDQAHLNRLFARHCGVTPGSWRRDLHWNAAEEMGGDRADPVRAKARVAPISIAKQD